MNSLKSSVKWLFTPRPQTPFSLAIGTICVVGYLAAMVYETHVDKELEKSYQTLDTSN